MTIQTKKTITNKRVIANSATKELSLPAGMMRKEIYQLVVYLSTHKKLKLSHSALRQYEHYIECTKITDWQKGNLCMNYRIVNELATILGITPRQVGYNNQQLANQGLIAYVDYGNYRRFGKRDENGCLIEDRSFGVDLKPVLGQLERFQQLKANIAWEQEQHQRLRNRVSHLRRKIFNAIPETLKESYADLLYCPRFSKHIFCESLRLLIC